MGELREARAREKRQLGGRRPATSGPIGRLQPNPEEQEEGGNGESKGSKQQMYSSSAPQILNELNQRLQQAGTGTWGRLPRGRGIVKERCKLPRNLLSTLAGEGGSQMSRVADMAGVRVSLEKGESREAILLLEGFPQGCRRARGIIQVKLKELVQRQRFPIVKF